MADRISRQELSRRMGQGDGLTLVEALGPDWWSDAHLPGALNLPTPLARVLAPELLPDRAATVVVYCSRTCAEADQVARVLEDLGYADVLVYPGGKEDWIEAGLPVERER